MNTTPTPDLTGDSATGSAGPAAPPGPAVAAAACLNCGRALPADARYCPHCGQDTRLRTPTVGEFVREFAGSFVAVEGPLWRTLKLLLLRPGELTREYLAGRRRHYVRPLRLYLSISLLVLIGMGALFQVRLDALRTMRLDVPSSHFVVFDFGVARAGLDRGRFYCEGLPERVCSRLRQRAARDPEGLWQLSVGSGQRFLGNLGTAMFVLVPMFALLMRVAFAGRPWRYAEHLVFALHLHAFAFVVLAVSVTQLPVVAQGVWLLLPAYALWAARRVYGGGWPALVLRLAGVALGYAFCLAVVLSLLMVWVLLN